MSDKIVRLARTFPTLAAAPLEPWDPVAFDLWAVGPVGTTGSRHAAAFVLSVWRVPRSPVAAVRKELCAELHDIFDHCNRRAFDLEETAPPLVGRRLCNARDKALGAWQSYARGELDEARAAAGLAAELAEVFLPLARWLAAERHLPAADVLRRLVEAETWRVGTFSATAALATWDREHREAFLAWAREPWFC